MRARIKYAWKIDIENIQVSSVYAETLLINAKTAMLDVSRVFRCADDYVEAELFYVISNERALYLFNIGSWF